VRDDPAAEALADYAPPSDRRDELLGPDGAPRRAWRPWLAAWEAMGPQARARLPGDARRRLEEAGAAYNPHLDPGGASELRGIDPFPLIFSAEDWAALEAGVAQRARLAELALDDYYGARSLLASGAIPPALVYNAGFIRDAAGWERPPRRRLFRYAADVTRGADGRWVLLDDIVDRPEGLGWTLANRVALAQAAPDLFFEAGARRLAPHFGDLREALEAETGVEGRIALLTPGPGDSCYFSHAYLARYMGLTLVEHGDLAARDGEVRVKTLEGLKRLDVALRAAPSHGVDPLYAPGAQTAAPAGALRAARQGRLAFANAVGAGVLDGRALAPVAAALCRDLLGADPLLQDAPSLWLGDAENRARYLEEPERWRLAPLTFSPRPGGALAPAPEIDDPARLARLLAREGWRWIARGAVETSGAPHMGRSGLESVSWAMRVFAVAGPDGWRVMPGGLASVTRGRTVDALPAEATMKDVWALGTAAPGEVGASALMARRTRTAHLRRTGRDLLSRTADNLFWLGRNAERAEAKLRVLKAVLERMIDAQGGDADPALLHALLSLRLDDAAEDAPEPTLAAARKRIVKLALDPAEPAALGHTLDALYWTADATRAHLSRDGWRDVSALAADPAWRAAPDPARALALAAPVEEALRSLAAFAGAAHENMTRNFAWRFLELGRRLERALGVAAMFRALIAERGADESARLHALLQLCDSYFAYRARYLTTPEAAPAIDLLILDESNPRSLAFQIARMDEELGALPRSTPSRNPEHKATLTLLTTLRCAEADALAAVDDAGARTALAAMLTEAEATLERIGSQIATAWFAHAEPVRTEVMASRSPGP
jgi:uncharacterized circularly permuted ATP-grasp superfamily protein/uncharacterized alpha-E superfamily protein